MHYLLFVTISVPDDSTSEDTRDSVYDDLMNDDSFCGGGGRFGSPLSDWFVIGGRWSGMLAETTIGDTYRAGLKARFPDLVKEWTPTALAEKKGAEFDAIWVESGGTGPSPHTRSGYEQYGYPDDAMPLTQQLFESHLDKYQGEDLYCDGGCEYVDLDHEPLEPDFIGRKWLVVVDYHC